MKGICGKVVFLILFTSILGCGFIFIFQVRRIDMIKRTADSEPFVDGFILQNKQHPYGIRLIPDNVRGLWTTKSQTHVIIHSQTGSPADEWVKTAANKLVAKDHNVILVNYTTVSLQSYVFAYLQVPYIGGDTCSLLVELYFYKDLDGFTVKLVGHGLGAQVAGYVGRCFTEATQARLHKITGLDPAVFLYWGTSTDRQLDASDALYVQTIHSSQFQFDPALLLGTS